MKNKLSWSSLMIYLLDIPLGGGLVLAIGGRLAGCAQEQGRQFNGLAGRGPAPSRHPKGRWWWRWRGGPQALITEHGPEHARHGHDCRFNPRPESLFPLHGAISPPSPDSSWARSFKAPSAFIIYTFISLGKFSFLYFFFYFVWIFIW